MHTAGALTEGKTENVEIAVSMYEPALNLQIWKSYADEVQIELVAPEGQQIGPFRQIQRAQRFVLGSTELLLYYGEPSPYSAYQEIYLDSLPVGQFIDSGLWTVRLIPQKIVTGLYNMWLPSGGVLKSGNRFPASCLRDNADRSVFCGESNYRRSLRCQIRKGCQFFRAWLHEGNRPGEAGSCGTRGGDHLLRTGWRLSDEKRYFHGNAFRFPGRRHC